MSLLARWTEIWEELHLPADPELHAELRHRYSEPQRAYHTLHHIRDCLEHLQRVRAQLERPAELELALWFHDAIYDPRRTDNEARSAAWAVRCLKNAGADKALCGRVQDLILLTRHNAEVGEGDARFMSDIDLAILGATPGRFDEYEHQIRREYRHVPRALFNSVRRKVLQDFLARPAIYLTESFHRSHEAAARANVARSLQHLARI